MALPAFASNPGAVNDPSVGAASTTASTSHAQSVAVGEDVALADATRDGYTATSQADLNAAALATQREAQRAALAASYASYTGPTAAENVAAASSAAATGTVATPGAFSLSAVYNTALQYVGTPYVFGGATPAGFDCSGFVMYVYSQYGISLPHSVTRQGAMGTPISAAEAQPGDVVIFNDGSHDGFYAGNGMILDAPKPGGSVSVRPLWTSAVHYVRYGA
nr:C40 family peptidase [Frigoribacterium sp. VKM Ac-2836]